MGARLTPDLLQAPFPVCGVRRTAASKTPTKQIKECTPSTYKSMREAPALHMPPAPWQIPCQRRRTKWQKASVSPPGTASVYVTFPGGPPLGIYQPTTQAPQGSTYCSHLNLNFFRATLKHFSFCGKLLISITPWLTATHALPLKHLQQLREQQSVSYATA